jgi:hypothetical protein
MLRGALISAAAMVPLTGAAPAQAEWIWQDLPPQVATPGAQQAESDLANQQASELAGDHLAESTMAEWTWQ